MPALNATTGMPAAIAFFTTGIRAGGSGRVTAMPSTLLSMALWMRFAWFADVGSDEYLRVTLSLAAAACAPLRMMSQNVSPGAAWVIMATVMLGVLALPAVIPVLLSAAFLPPVLLQAPAANRTPMTRTEEAARLAWWNMSSLRGGGGVGAPGGTGAGVVRWIAAGSRRGREVH